MTFFNPAELKTPPRADMYLPNVLKYFGFFLYICALGGVVAAFITSNWALLIITLLAGPLGIAAWLCWKNQTIRIIGEDHFEYTTFLGKTTVYRFSDIKGFRINPDSITLFFANGKVHIESMACISQKLVDKIEKAAAENGAA